MQDRNQIAFPIVQGRQEQVEAKGLTKREMFAAMAMQGMLHNPEIDSFYSPDTLADMSVQYGDALIEELKKAPK